MEDKFYNDEFEQFLQQQVNNHRMYPTDGVWQGIYKKLHGDKKWPALTIAAFTFLTAIIAISVYFAPKPNIFALSPAKTPIPAEPNKQAKGYNTPLISAVSDADKNTKVKDYVSRQNGSQPVESVSGNIPAPIELFETDAEKVIQPDKLLLSSTTSERRLPTADASSSMEARTNVTDNAYTQKPADNSQSVSPAHLNSTVTGVKEDFQTLDEQKATIPAVNTPVASKLEKDRDDKNMADDFLKQHINDISLYTTTKKLSQKKKFSYTVYIAPSMSYRKLKEEDLFNHKSSNTNGPVALNYVTDVNKVVRHKPGTGIETGVAFIYHLSNTLGVRAGFQFNVRQYNIEAYKANGEPATIALLGRSGNVDSINSVAIYRNNNGYRPVELVNRYYQLSIPVGLEWEVTGNNKVKFNIAASIQPTYTINRNSYLLTTDYKNYTANQAMLRSWNINSNIEAFMSIKVGEYKWQLGPQLRYQHLPTFITEYPIREHLMDYGFKIGVSKFIK